MNIPECHEFCPDYLSVQRIWHNSGFFLLSCKGMGPHWHIYCRSCHREWPE